MSRRLWAQAALVLALAALLVAIAEFIGQFPRGLTVLAGVVLGALCGWYALRRRGAVRIIGAVAAIVLFAAAILILILEGKPLVNLVVIAAALAALAAARGAFKARVELPPATPPKRPVLFYNPKSGGGKAEKFNLADEARSRGFEAVELKRGDDLEQLVRDAVSRGADGLAMAGGDGSQAVVAKVAAELKLPYACIPAGTRNHFALDLGVDRDDVVGALEAFVDGGERIVDLATVNGQVFVNNVSLGLYAEAVQSPGYRENKLETLLGAVPDSLGPDAKPSDLHWEGEGGNESGAVVLVSNNRYRLGPRIGTGTRPRLDGGELGIVVFAPAGATAFGLKQWTQEEFEVEATEKVPAGIDGEALMLDPPLRFRTVPRALRVRIAPAHPGASPSMLIPDSPWATVRELGRYGFGRSSEPA